MAHYVVYKRSDGKWGVPILSMFIDAPEQAEQKLGEYVLDTLADGKELAQDGNTEPLPLPRCCFDWFREPEPDPASPRLNS
jgi:hypothetical protein